MKPLELKNPINENGAALLRLRRAGVTYPGGARALLPVSLDFSAGEFTVLLGPSGAGKSTLLRCLNLLVRPTLGSVHAEPFGELNTSHRIREHRRRTGMIFQHHQLLPRQSALRNTLTGRLAYHAAWRSLLPLPRAERRWALECLERVGLRHKALQRADRLSGGERQRVGVARALAQRPRLILADEPVASLDPATARRLLSLLRSIRDQDGIAIIVSLHQVAFAREFADRVVGLSGGRVVFDGPACLLDETALDRIYGAPHGGADPPALFPHGEPEPAGSGAPQNPHKGTWT